MSGPDTGTITRSQKGPVVTLTFENPPEGYMDQGTETALTQHLAAIEADDTCRVVIMTGGQEGVFIRHYDTRVLENQSNAMRKRGLADGSGSPMRAAVVISRISLVNNLPRFASWAFLRC